MLGSRAGSGEPRGEPRGEPMGARGSAEPKAPATAGGAKKPGKFDDMEDDIPF
jgi:hypothetical protein